MAIDFAAWNEQFGGEEAKKELQNAQAKDKEYKEVPNGTYICALEKLELGETKDHRPMVKAQLRIMEGSHKKQCLFYNQVFTRGFPQHKALEFLRSLQIFDDSEVDFDGNFETFNDLLLDMAEEAASMTFEIKKDMDGEYTRLQVTDVFD